MEAFRLKASLARLLEENAKGRYAVITPQRRRGDAESIFEKPQVTVFYAEGSFDRGKSSGNSPYTHNPTYLIHVLAGTKAAVNRKALENPDSTPEQYAAALAAGDSARLLLDEKMEGLLSILYNVIMMPENRRLGTDYVTNRWVAGMKKYNPEPMGSIVTGAATITLLAQCPEVVTGEEGVSAGEGPVDTVVDLGDSSKQGATA